MNIPKLIDDAARLEEEIKLHDAECLSARAMPEKVKTPGVAAVAGGLGQSERKTAFIRQLADFLAGDQAAKGIALQIDMMRPAGDSRPLLAKEWAELRGKSPLMGYPTVDEAVEQLTRFLA